MTEDSTDENPSTTFLEDIQHVVTQIEQRKGIEELNGPIAAAQEQSNVTVVVSQNNSVLNEGVTENEGEVDLDESIIGPSVVFTFEASF